MRPVGIAALVLAALPLSVGAADGIRVGEETVVAASRADRDIRGTPHVARGQRGYLAVWREGWNGEGGTARIRAARLDDSGKVLDPAGIELAPCRDGFQELPRVASGGGVFLVVWQDFRNGKDYDILGARVSPEGKVLDAQPIAIATGPGTQAAPDIASDGKDFLVAWQAIQTETNTFRVQAARVGADGRLGAASDDRSPWTKAAAAPKLAWDGSHYRIVFVSQSLLSLRLNPDGSVPEKDQAATLRGNLGAAIGFSHSVAATPGKGMLAVFPRSQPDYWGWGGPGAMICCPVGMDGKRDATLPREESPQTKLGNWLDFGKEKGEGSPWPHGASAVAWDGRHFVVVWQRHHIRKTVTFANADLLAARVDGWKPLDEGVTVAGSELEEKSPALASDGAGNLLCVYEKHTSDGRIAIVARVLQAR